MAKDKSSRDQLKEFVNIYEEVFVVCVKCGQLEKRTYDSNNPGEGGDLDDLLDVLQTDNWVIKGKELICGGCNEGNKS
jgi:hypothetical protein